jgi:predicted RND superfamily exporter protein
MKSSSVLSVPARRSTAALAKFVATRTGWLVVLAVALAAAALLVITTQSSLDSEVLNLLPKKFPSVIGLRLFNSEFSNARQLVFGFLAEPGHADDLEPFREHFMNELRQQPWVVRTFDRIPLDTDEGLQQIRRLEPSLLLNLPPAEFKEAMADLNPQTIEQRLTHLREMLSGDSISSQYEVQIDPLGLFARAMKPFGSASSMDQGSSLTSDDGLLQIGLVTLNLPDLGAKECQRMMDQVNQLRDRVLNSWSGYKPRVLITGRTAYVAEISRSMDHDALLSSTLSIIIVSGLFYLAFRRVLPLIGICLVLALSTAVALAIGMLLLRNLNMIAIGFCSILIGIGVDFSFLLFGRYLQARRAGSSHVDAVYVSVRDIGAAIFYVVLTTAIGFLALRFSQSAGFAQLGTLVALGVGFAGLFSILFLFLFFKPVRVPLHSDFMLIGAERFVRAVFRRPRQLLSVSLSILLVGAAIALTPFIPLKFDTNPRSLEPKRSPASIALQTMGDKLKQESDPIMILVDARDQEEFHDRWQKLTDALEAAQQRGELKYVSTPIALAFSPRRFAENRAYLKGIDFRAIEASARGSLERNGFQVSAFSGIFNLLHALEAEKAATGIPAWNSLFPEDSPWWFLVERYFSDTPTRGVGFVRPAEPLKTEADQRRLGEMIRRIDPGAIVTGWTFTLFDLVPWARGELIGFTVSVAALILILLWIVFRRFSLWLVHSSALILSMLALVASLKLLHVSINLLNALAFPLVLAIGVDHGIQFLIVSRREGVLTENLANVLKALSICGLTAVAGFAVLIPAQNPALSGLGTVCALGIAWCLLTTFCYIVPAFAFLHQREKTSPGSDVNDLSGMNEVDEMSEVGEVRRETRKVATRASNEKPET